MLEQCNVWRSKNHGLRKLMLAVLMWRGPQSMTGNSMAVVASSKQVNCIGGRWKMGRLVGGRWIESLG